MTKIHVLLDPIRDRAYLQSLTNPTSTAPDAGVGLIDNPFFFEAGHYKNGILSSSVATSNNKRLFFCWFGSPQGTTNESPKFSLFCARVNEEEFDLEKPAPQWLDPPFLVLSYDQLSRDIINWFDNIMNANGISASNGVATVSSTTYVPGYGYINGTVNVTGTPELKQVHFVYDPLDDTVLMYLSMMTPNWNPNQKTIYVYKFPVSLLEQGQSINSYAVNGLTPTTTQTPPPNDKPYFLGGLSFDDVFMQSFYSYWSSAFGSYNLVNFNSPQFTISFDYFGYTKAFGYSLSKGYLPAAIAVVLGNMIWASSTASGTPSSLEYPHGDGLVFAILQDIHNNPAKPTVFRLPNYGNGFGSSPTGYYVAFSHFPALDENFSESAVNIDKLGSIIPMESDGILGGYAIPYTTPPRIDYTLASMRMKVMFIEPVTWLSPFPDSGQPIGWFVMASTIESVIDPVPPYMGLCRPYVFSLHNKTFVTLGGYHYDNYINAVAVEIDKRMLSPSSYRRLAAKPANVPLLISSPTASFSVGTGTFGMNGRLIGSFGKKAAIIKLGNGYANGIIAIPFKYATEYGYGVLPPAPHSGGLMQTYIGYPMGGQNVNVIGYIGDANASFIEFKIPANGRFIDITYFAYKNPGIILTDEEEGE